MITRFNEYFKVEMIKYDEIIPSESTKIINFSEAKQEKITITQETAKKLESIGSSLKKDDVNTENKQEKTKKSRYEEIKDIDEPPF